MKVLFFTIFIPLWLSWGYNIMWLFVNWNIVELSEKLINIAGIFVFPLGMFMGIYHVM